MRRCQVCRTGQFLMLAVASLPVMAPWGGQSTALGQVGTKLPASQLPPPAALSFPQCLVIAPETMEISAQETGLIRELLVDENSHVDPEQTIVKLDAETLLLEKSVAELQYRVALSEAEDDSDVRFADMVVEEAKLQLESYEEMEKKRGAGPIEVRQKKIAWEQAKVRAVQARSLKAQKELKAKLSAATLELSRQKLERLNLKSPAHGIVTRIDHRAGEWVSAGTPLLKVVRMDRLRVDFFVDLQQFDPAHLVGRKMHVILEGGPSSPSALTFPAQITGYSPEVSSLGRVRVSAMVENKRQGNEWGLLPGMNVSLVSPAGG